MYNTTHHQYKLNSQLVSTAKKNTVECCKFVINSFSTPFRFQIRNEITVVNNY